MYGDATSKEVINFLSLNQTLPAADKVRRAGCQPVHGHGCAPSAARCGTHLSSLAWWHPPGLPTPSVICTPPHSTPLCPCQAQVRLLMCYSATHLEKLDATRQQQWQKVARLTPEDMACVTNLEYLGVPGEGRGAGAGDGLQGAGMGWSRAGQGQPLPGHCTVVASQVGAM